MKTNCKNSSKMSIKNTIVGKSKINVKTMHNQKTSLKH